MWLKYRSFVIVCSLLVLSCVLVGCPTAQQQNLPTIIIANYGPLKILADTERGVVDELSARGYRQGKTARIVVRSANGDPQQISAIAREVAIQQPDVAVAISTPIAQAIVKAIKNQETRNLRDQGTQVVFGALTDPVGAGVVSSMNGDPGVTGTTDALPYSEELKLIRRILPRAERVGLLFNPGEAASQHALEELQRDAPSLGFELIKGAVTTTNDVYPVASSLGRRSDLLLISTDNTVASGIAGAVKVGVNERIPVFAFDSGSVERGAIAAISAGYYDIGRHTGALVAKLLGGARQLRVVTPTKGELYVNSAAADEMGVKVPAEVRNEATKVYTSIEQ